MPNQRAFTLWELLCTLSIGAVLVALATPPFTDVLLDGRRTADVNAFVLAVQLARSEAAKRSRAVVLCATADLTHCAATGTGYRDGWMVYVDVEDAGRAIRSPAEPLLYTYVPAMVGTITSNRPLYEFRPGRRRSTNGTVVFCDRRGSTAARAAIVSYTGRPRVSERAADGRPLSCADST